MRLVKSRSRKNKIKPKLNFTENQSIALCMRVDRDSIVTQVRQSRSIRRKNMSTASLYCKCNHIVFRHIRERLADFARQYGFDLSEIPFQSDGDCDAFLKVNGLGRCKKGDAHTLADVVASACGQGRKNPPGVVFIDPHDVVEQELKQELS